MKITRKQLGQIIREEFSQPLNEAEPESKSEEPDQQQAKGDSESRGIPTEGESEPYIFIWAWPSDTPIGVNIVPWPADDESHMVIFGYPAGAQGKVGKMNIYLVDDPGSMKTKALAIAKEFQSNATEPVGIKSMHLEKLGSKDPGPTVSPEVLAQDFLNAKIVEPIPEKS